MRVPSPTPLPQRGSMLNGSKFAGLALATDVAQRMTIIHPVTRQPLRRKDGTEAWIDLFSMDSDAWRSGLRAQQDRRLRLRSRANAEELEADATEMYAVVTKNWSLCTLDGEPLDVPCNPVNARELYSMRALSWLRDQVDAFVADRGNFQRATSTSSSSSPAMNGG